MSGKTALARHIVLSLLRSDDLVLFVDLQAVPRAKVDEVLAINYHRQFRGDYSVWLARKGKTIVLDNLSPDRASIEFVESIENDFDRIIVFAGTDIFASYYKDDTRLARFTVFQIRPLTLAMQENLIRKRLSLMGETIKDGTVDQMEKKINSVVSGRLVPRYPFYVLSIIQTLELFMPSDLTVSSHGHCYYIWILARLMKAGIPRRDDAINVCLNLAEHLSFSIYKQTTANQRFTRAQFDRFIRKYRKTYVVPDSILSRLTHRDYGPLERGWHFSSIVYVLFLFGTLFGDKQGRED